MSKRRTVLTYQYDNNNFDPPAPVLEVSLTIPAAISPKQIIRLPALLDSGADMTVIPQWIVQQLQLKYVDEVLVSGYDEVTKKAFVYSVKIIFNNLEEFVIRAVALSKDLVLVGRDILNKWSLFLKGRSKTFEIS